MALASCNSISNDFISVTYDKLDLANIIKIVQSPQCGAISTFLGVTRDFHDGKKVKRLEYEGYVPMAELELQKICQEIRLKWNVQNIAICHKLGVTMIEEASVIIAISSIHRRESLESVNFCIDELKAKVPIWKLEVYEGDSRVWKENSEWKNGINCRKMIPREDAEN